LMKLLNNMYLSSMLKESSQRVREQKEKV